MLIRTTLYKMPNVPFLNVERSKNETRRNPNGFFMGGSNRERKFYLVSWKLVCMSKENGGLGIHDLLKRDYTIKVL